MLSSPHLRETPRTVYREQQKKNDFGVLLKEYEASLAVRLAIRKYGRFVSRGTHMNEDFFEGV